MNSNNTDSIVIIFKSELDGHPRLAHQLSNLSQETAQIGQACIYVPKPDTLDSILILLKSHHVRFGQHCSSGKVDQKTEG